jgi:hypothetical protein
MTQKILICGLLCWITTQSFAQVYEIMRDDEWTHPYEYTIVTHEFTVLDINTENHTLAFRHVYEMYEMDGVEPFGDYTGKPHNCKYPGMESKPYAGVILGIYNLKTLEYEHVFHVYKSVYYKNRCMTHEESTNALDSAKSMFQEYALNIDKKPKAIQFKQLNDSISEVKIRGIRFHSLFQDIGVSLEWDYLHLLTLKLYANDKLFFQQQITERFPIASSGQSFWHSAYIIGNQVVFMNKTEYQYRDQVYIEGEHFYFSPIFQISDFQ